MICVETFQQILGGGTSELRTFELSQSHFRPPLHRNNVDNTITVWIFYTDAIISYKRNMLENIIKIYQGTLSRYPYCFLCTNVNVKLVNHDHIQTCQDWDGDRICQEPTARSAGAYCPNLGSQIQIGALCPEIVRIGESNKSIMIVTIQLLMIS